MDSDALLKSEVAMNRALPFAVVFLTVASGAAAQELFELPRGVETRWYSFENPTGQQGNGGRANQDRKGGPPKFIHPAEPVELADIPGPGVRRPIMPNAP